jgi:hypothetical protein
MRSMSALCWQSAEKYDAFCVTARFSLAVLHTRHANPEGVQASRQLLVADGMQQPVQLKPLIPNG